MEVRGQRTLEILASQTNVDMDFPVVTAKARNLGYRFMVAEAWWILTGQNAVETIKPYSKQIERFSDDGVHFAGAYGPPVIDQLTYIVDSLQRDKQTRQAVLSIWRPNPRDSKDIPCTVSVQWLIRDNYLHCIDNMRSSDAWLGWPYDIFNFTMLTAHILQLLKKRGSGYENLELGTLTLNAGSQHLYERDLENVEKVLKNEEEYPCPGFIPDEIFGNYGSIPFYLELVKDSNRYPVPLSGFLQPLFKERYGDKCGTP